MDDREQLIWKYLKNVKHMKDEDCKYFIKTFNNLTEAEKSELIYEMVGKEIYETNPVDISTFINDPYFLGEIYSGTVFKIWVDLLNEIYPAPFCKKYDQVVLSCGTRSGKSVVTAISLLYEIYLLTCMINPAKFLTGVGTKNIVIAVLSKDNPTALSQVGAEIYKGLSQAPYFNGVVREKLSFSKAEKDGTQLTDNILLRVGSTLGTVIGTDLYAGCLDEANIKPSTIAADRFIESRLAIYKEMRDRHYATFSKAPKRSGILWFTSSPTDEGDVLGEIIQQVKDNAIPDVLIRDNIARWEAREEDTNDTFDFFLGSDTKDPCIVDESIELKPEEWDRVIQVPNTAEYYNSFKTNPYFAIQNIAGRRTMPEMALFNSVGIFEKVFFKEQTIFRSDTPVITLENFKSLDDYMLENNKDYFLHPDRPDCFRYIHLDMAYRGDRFGLASVYSDRIKYTSEDGHEIMRRKYFVDFCLGITTKNRETVDILKVLEFVYSLKEKGYPIKLVTTDNHQGEIARQMIAKRGVKTEYLSMEKTKEPYLNLKNVIITESLEGFKNPALIKELRGLRESAKKIEKGKGYTDDMSDALAGALWSCSQDRFFKKNNEAISELIQQTGKFYTGLNMLPPTGGRGFSGIADQLRNRKGKRNLGFRYGNQSY